MKRMDFVVGGYRMVPARGRGLGPGSAAATMAATLAQLREYYIDTAAEAQFYCQICCSRNNQPMVAYAAAMAALHAEIHPDSFVSAGISSPEDDIESILVILMVVQVVPELAQQTLSPQRTVGHC